jgi:4-hydroxybenzoate polyprenyltransferase
LQTLSIKYNFLNLYGLIRVFARDIKLSHSVFALPFVGVALTLTGIDSLSATKLGLIAVSMVLARSFAMGMNRYLDKDIDSGNERTSSRALPAGKVTSRGYLSVTISCGLVFVLTAFQLSRLAGVLSPLLLLILASYSLMKRLSWLTHWYLGGCLGLAPIATEIALFDRISIPVVLVGIAVAFWTAGFDLLYSLQDREFDVKKGLHSVPANFGFRSAIWLSRLSFLVMMLSLSAAGVMSGAGVFWWIGIALVSAILFAEHWLIRGAMNVGTSDKINVAFFNLNAMVSVAFFIFSALNAYAQS